jgi:hypothetical protein
MVRLADLRLFYRILQFLRSPLIPTVIDSLRAFDFDNTYINTLNNLLEAHRIYKKEGGNKRQRTGIATALGVAVAPGEDDDDDDDDDDDEDQP